MNDGRLLAWQLRLFWCDDVLVMCFREAGSHDDVQCVGDLLLKLMRDLKVLQCVCLCVFGCSEWCLMQLFVVSQSVSAELQMTSECVCALEKACAACHRLERVCREFELQKVCYVPLNVFLLRPGHRLLHYTQILNRLLKHYPETHTHHTRCTGERLHSYVTLS